MRKEVWFGLSIMAIVVIIVFWSCRPCRRSPTATSAC